MLRRPKVLFLAGILLLAATGILFWKNVGIPASSPGSKLPVGVEKARSRPSTPSQASPAQEGPAVRSRTAEENKDVETISGWLADESVTPEMAAEKLWSMASDPSRSVLGRDEALTHALNLTDDETFRSKVIPLLGKRGLWPDAMGEKILDELYNRPGELKIPGALALFQNSTGDLHDNLRTLLAFELGGPGADAEEMSDAEVIRLASERPK